MLFQLENPVEKLLVCLQLMSITEYKEEDVRNLKKVFEYDRKVLEIMNE